MTAPRRTGYTFAGWATEPAGEVVYAAADVATAPVGTTLYAVYTEGEEIIEPDDSTEEGATGEENTTPAA